MQGAYNEVLREFQKEKKDTNQVTNGAISMQTVNNCGVGRGP